MINKWILDNFKSINEEKNLEFRPLTIFTGANSSGKSTILQSILLVTQTLQDSIPSRSIVLNGWFKKFGSYDDIVNRRDYTKDIKIGFSVTMDDVIRNRWVMGPWDEEVNNVDCSILVASNNKPEDLLPHLKELKLNTTGEKEKKYTLKLTKISEPSKEIQKVVASVKERVQQSELEYKVETNFENTRRFIGRTVGAKYIGAGLTHFLPSYLLYFYNQVDRIKEIILDVILGGRQSYAYMFDDMDVVLDKALSKRCLAIVDEIDGTVNKKSRTYESLYRRLHNSFKFELFVRFIEAAHVDDITKASFVSQLQDELSKLPASYSIDRLPIHYQPGVDCVKEFFCDHIKYLGPLREEPKALYPLESIGSTLDLGLKGENTAAVFQNNKEKIISYVDPDYFGNSVNQSPTVITGSLAEAINKWLVYLGVANDMSAIDKGKFGHELKITTEIKDMKQDLTHVGVGVSQILPILVLCFLSDKGDSIILEQPELHLHPKVQTRLADFFVSMNALGKQCILETHSEYLINRLRLLVAKADDKKISDETMIYFVEKDKEMGCSKYREITINPYGKIDKWPDGFFDEGEDLASQIVSASIEKKRREKLKEKK